jgi:hypothetical protein
MVAIIIISVRYRLPREKQRTKRLAVLGPERFLALDEGKHGGRLEKMLQTPQHI